MKLLGGRPTTLNQTAPADDSQPVPAQPWWGALLRRRPGRERPAGVAWQHGDVLATRALHALLVAALVAGPAALLWLAAGHHASSSVATLPAPSAPSTDQAGTVRASAAAQQLVFTWLTASAADLSALQRLTAAALPTTINLPEKKPAPPAEQWVVEAEAIEPGHFRVVVAAVGTSGGVAYYAVPVTLTDATAIAATLPARTTRPAALADPKDLAPRLTALASSDPAYNTVGGYVTAYLTGSAQLDRWTSPDSGLTAIIPRACVRVHLDQVAVPEAAAATPGTTLPILATATCTTGDGSVTTSQYGLELHLRDGRWEVAAEAPGLLTSDESHTPQPTDPSTTPTPSTR